MSKLIHFLIPKEFRVWCRPSKGIGTFSITTDVSKVTCAVCLTAFRSNTKGIKRAFSVKHVAETREIRDYGVI